MFNDFLYLINTLHFAHSLWSWSSDIGTQRVNKYVRLPNSGIELNMKKDIYTLYSFWCRFTGVLTVLNLYIWRNFIFIFGLEISPIPPKRGLYDGKVWMLLYDLSFGDDPSIFQFWPHADSNRRPGRDKPAC